MTASRDESTEIPPGSGAGGVVWSNRPPKEWARTTPQAKGRGVWVYVDGETVRRALGRLPQLRLEVKRAVFEKAGSAKILLTIREVQDRPEER